MMDVLEKVSREVWENLKPVSDWRYEVENGDTSLGWDAWIENQAGIESGTMRDAVERLSHGATRAFMADPDIDAGIFAIRVMECLSDLRMCDDEAFARAAGMLGKAHDPGTLSFGETACVLPREAREAISRVAHLGMVAWEGRTNLPAIDEAILDLERNFGLAPEAAAMARVRQGIEGDVVKEDDRPAP